MGVDFTAGKPSRASGKLAAQFARLKKGNLRKERLQRFSKAAGQRAKTIFTQGVNPAVLYGACVRGVSNTALRALKRQAAAATAPRGKGRSLNITLALAQLAPTGVACSLPMARWAKQLWNSTLPWLSGRAIPTNKLFAGWWATKPHLTTSWAACRGPMAAAALSAKRKLEMRAPLPAGKRLW